MATQRYRNLLFSIIASALLAVFTWFLFFPAEGVPGKLFVIVYLAHILFLGLGFITFILRLFRLAPMPRRLSAFLDPANNPHKFFYIFMGTANFFLGFLPLILYWAGLINDNMFRDFWPHLPLAFILMGDSFFVKHRHAEAP